MKRDRLHVWLTLGANLGVIIGLLLLVVELRQNAAMMRAQTRNDLSASAVELFVRVAENSQLADLRRRADAGEELTVAELYQYNAITRGFLRYWENIHYQYRQGLYDYAEFSRQREAWSEYAARSDALVRFWCAQRTAFSDPFVAEFDGLLSSDA